MRRLLPAVLLLAALAPSARGQTVVAALSSDEGAYREALEAFETVYGSTVPVIPVGRKALLNPETKIVVAFGGKAAGKRYPENVALVYGLAPGVDLGPGTPQAPIARVLLVPRPERLVEGVKRVQPRARRLAVLWSRGMSEYSGPLKKAGAEAGLTIVSARVDDASDLPATLRSLDGSVDALWLAPDPSLVTPETVELLRDFSRSTRIAFYAPTAGLAGEGATASIGIGFGDVGETAAGLVRRLLSGERVAGDFFPAGVELSAKGDDAARLGLSISTDVVKLGGTR